MKKLLVVVDYQNDFVNGALGFEGAEKLEAGIVARVESTLGEGGYVLFTQDTHGADYLKTREGRFIPVAHCVAGTPGHRLYGRLGSYEVNRMGHKAVLDKPTFGAADIAKAAEALCEGEPDEIYLCGLVTDICVVTNTLLLHSAFTKARVVVLTNLCGSGNAPAAKAALDVMRGLGIEMEDG